MVVEPHFDPCTCTLTWLVWDPATRDALVIDPVLGFEAASGRVDEEAVAGLVARIEAEGLRPHLVLETHAHADHLTGSQALRRRLGLPVAIGRHITTVQRRFGPILGLDLATDGRQFDHLLADGDTFAVGSFDVSVFDTPGHTPACVTYRIGEHLFTGDALFMPDQGTGRCDFPDGSANDLYRSLLRIHAQPGHFHIHPAHDYQPGGRPLRSSCTVAESRAANIHARDGVTAEAFVAFRTSRDATLKPPTLLYPSLQVNLEAGRLPAADADGRRYLKLPLTVVGA
jgi:glyoxylase-like metal-dependent hydrolase (beta-lactamase superfamily II)